MAGEGVETMRLPRAKPTADGGVRYRYAPRMPVSPRHVPWTILLPLVAVGCTSAPRTEPPRPMARGRAAVEVIRDDPSRPSTGLYAAPEALSDALSGRWEYLGTGRWPGINRAHACAFRNDRVLMVNAYCTITETPAFRVDVYSPERGRVRIYAEANGPVSVRTRADYFTFRAESEPRPGPDASLPGVALTMSFEELRAYDRERYAAFLPVCFGGEERHRRQQGCLGPLSTRVDEWGARNRHFLEHASHDWYRLVQQMRDMAVRHGKELN